MLCHRKDVTSINWWVWCNFLWCCLFKTSEEAIQLFCQRGIATHRFGSGFMVGDVSDPQPHLLWVVAIEVVLNSLFIIQLGPSDAPSQVCPGWTVEFPVSRSEGGVSLPQQGFNLMCHPGFLIGIHPNAFVSGDSICAVFDVTENRCSVTPLGPGIQRCSSQCCQNNPVAVMWHQQAIF